MLTMRCRQASCAAARPRRQAPRHFPKVRVVASSLSTPRSGSNTHRAAARSEAARRSVRPDAPQGRPGKKRLQPGKKPKQTEITVPSAQKRVIRIDDNVQLQTLAQRMSLKATDVLMKLMELGVSGVHINSTLDADTAAVLAGEFNYEVENVAKSEDEIVGDARGRVRGQGRRPSA